MASNGGRRRGGNEEKAFDTSTRYQRTGFVNSSSRPSYGTSSRNSHHNASLHNGREARYDRRPRSRSPYRRDRQRSRSPYRADRDRSRSPYRANRNRSRSPYRASKHNLEEKREHDGNQAIVGDKRENDGDHYNVGEKREHDDDHYEDKAMIKRRLRTYPDDSSAVDEETVRAYKKYGLKVPERDHSPLRQGQQTLSNIIIPSNPAVNHVNHLEHADDINKFLQAQEDAAMAAAAAAAADTAAKAAAGASSSATNLNDATESKDDHVQLSDADLIEQRRARREAIKAKHRQQPLLQKALEQNMLSAPSTPVHESLVQKTAESSSSAPDHQQLPVMGSPQSPAPFSPASFSADNMEDVIEHHDEPANYIDEGPSAADYDPSMDMQETRKQISNLQDQNVTKEVLPSTEQSADLDMFADGDDDMFAVADKYNMEAITKEARTLDRRLLDNWDYPDGHYRVIIGELLDNKYAVQQQIGKGTFATVVRAQEVGSGRAVAIKIACNNDTMYKAGTKELEFLTLLNETDPEDKRHIIRLLGRFDHKGHMCIVFENLNADLRETLKKYGRNVGINLVALRSFSHQMFQALLHMQRNEILHADLKPDNILVSEKLNLLKICDLGTASKIIDAEITPYLVSRFYRAPEVMLGIPLDYAIDMWSIGCTLFELYTGRILFAGSDNNQMLRVVQECRGKIPNRMLKKSTLFDRHFDQFGNFISIERDKITGHTAMRQPNLTKIASGKDLRSRVMASIKDSGPATIKEAQAFADLLDKCLQLDPARRITPSEALKHHFITHIIPGKEGERKKIAALAPVRAR